ncbi:inorganic phosphate transporter [Nesterenkonia populi]|uniref:inorganic phosphate transporter n=1 Tax=Nesterenkonia populi TaxID=1591087 RepID=UPI0011BF76A2|nr:inorganic phosphate transporter [Nesterenkonia populi]
MELLLLALVVVVLVPTLYLSGLHDVPNAIAIPVRTRALTARAATRLAAACTAAGVLSALPVGLYLYTWFDFPSMSSELTLLVVLVSLLTVLGWSLHTYFQGMPTSITHILLSALLGATLAAAVVSGAEGQDILGMPWMTPILPLLVSPVAAFLVAYLLVFLAARLVRGEEAEEINRTSRMAQCVSVGLTSFGTGIQQGQRFLMVALIALTAAGVPDGDLWLGLGAVLCAGVIALGCLNGGWRIGHVLGHRLVAMDPLRGMVSTTTTAGLLVLGSLVAALPLSTSFTAASAIMGAGSNQRFATVNWRQFRRIALYWAATPVVGVVAAAALTFGLSHLL